MGNVKKGVAFNLLYQLVNIAMPLITAPYISRILGPEGIGEYSYAFTIATYFVYFIMLGINNHGVRIIAKCTGKDEKSAAFWNLYTVQFLEGLIFLSVYLLYCAIVKDFSIVSLMLTFYVVSGMLDINWFYFGNEDFKTPAFRNVIVKLLLTVLIFVLVKEASQIWLYSLLMGASYLFSQIIMWTSVWGKLDYVKPDWKKVGENIKPLLILFVPVIAVSLYNLMGRIMLGAMSNMEQLGFYESAAKIIGVPSVFTVALGQVMLPRASKMFGVNDKVSYREFYKSIDIVCFFAIGMAFGIISISKVFTVVYYGDSFSPASTVMAILAMTLFFSPWASVIRTQLLIPKKKDKIYVISVTYGAIINLVINIFLIPLYGAIGAAIATVIAEASVAIIQCCMINREIPIISKLTKNLVWVIPGITMVIVLNYVDVHLSVDLFIKLLIMVVVGGGVFLAMSAPIFLLYKQSNKI